MPPRKKKVVIESNQKDIRSWVKDNRIVISEDKTNVSNIGKTISESSLALLKETNIIKTGFIDMTKNNVAEELKAEIERQIVERCDKAIWGYKRKRIKSYIEKRFYRLYDYKKEKLSLYQIRLIEDFDRFPEPRVRINVPFEKVTWDQFIYSNVIALSVYNIQKQMGVDFEIDDELLLEHLELFYLNYLNNRGRKIPFRNQMEFYELKPGLKLDFRDLLPSQIKMKKIPMKKSINKIQGKNQITVVVDVHHTPVPQQPITAARDVVKKQPVVKKKSAAVFDYDCIQVCDSQSNIDLERKTNGAEARNCNYLEQQPTSKSKDFVNRQPSTKSVSEKKTVRFNSPTTANIEKKASDVVDVQTRKFIGFEEFKSIKKVVEYLDIDMKKKFPHKYEKMKETRFSTYLEKLYKVYKSNEIFFGRVSNWVTELKNEKQETDENLNTKIPVEAMNQHTIEKIPDTVDEAISEQAIIDGDVVIKEKQIEETTEIIVDGDVVNKKKQIEEITDIIAEETQTVDELPEKSIDVDGDVLMKIVEDSSNKTINNIEILEEIPMQIDEISQTSIESVKPALIPKCVNKIDLMEIDEDSDDVVIKVEQFSPYTDDVEEIIIPETLPHTIEDSFNINNYFDNNSEESLMGRKEMEAMNALELHEFSAVPIPIKRPANIKETTGGNVISKHQYQQLNLNIKQRPFNTHQTGSQSQFIDPESLSQCIENDVSQTALTQCIENDVSQAALLNTDNSVFVDSQLLRKSNNKVIKKTIIIQNKLKETKSLILAKLSKKSQGLLKKRKIIKKLRKRKPIDLSKIHFLNDLFISSVKYGLNKLSFNSGKSKISMKIQSGLKTINLTHEEDIRIVTGLKRKEFCTFVDLIKKSENFEYNRFENSDRIGNSTIDRVLKLFLMTIPRFKSILLILGNNGEDDFKVLECTNSVQSILPTQNASMVLDPYVRLRIENAKKCISDINC